MNIYDEVTRYLDFCQYRKELNRNTLKAYRIDLAQFQKFIGDDYLARHKIENYITDLHMHYKQKTVKRKIASVKAFSSKTYVPPKGCVEDPPVLCGIS